MQYTDKQIEEAVEKTVVQNPLIIGHGVHSGTLVDLTKLIMRMVGEQLDDRIAHHLEGWHNAKRYKSLDPLPEFWKEPEETPEETRSGGVDVSNGPLTVEKQAQGWQQIETAPLGHIFVICYHSEWDLPVAARYSRKDQLWMDYAFRTLNPQPTHWMPIPPLPEDK